MTPETQAFRWGLALGSILSPLVILGGAVCWALFVEWRRRKAAPKLHTVTFQKQESHERH